MLKKNTGKISSAILILAALLVIVIIIVFVVLKVSSVKNTPNTPATNNSTTTPVQPPKPVYDATIGDIKFIFESAQDLGSVLESKSGYQQNLTTTEKYIKVIIGAQNKGKTNLQQGAWDIGSIVDSDGRNFVSINEQAYSFLPNPNTCGALLKPEFEPTPCVKLYEVSRESLALGADGQPKPLKIEINFIVPGTTKRQEAFLDLVIH